MHDTITETSFFSICGIDMEGVIVSGDFCESQYIVLTDEATNFVAVASSERIKSVRCFLFGLTHSEKLNERVQHIHRRYNMGGYYYEPNAFSTVSDNENT